MLQVWKQNLDTDNTNNSINLTPNTPTTAWIWGIAPLLDCISLSWNHLSTSHPQQHNDRDGFCTGGSEPQPPLEKLYPPQGTPQSSRPPEISSFKQAIQFLTAWICPGFSGSKLKVIGKKQHSAHHEPLDTQLIPREHSLDPSLQHL